MIKKNHKRRHKRTLLSARKRKWLDRWWRLNTNDLYKAMVNTFATNDDVFEKSLEEFRGIVC